MINKPAKWMKYTGSDEQIIELQNAEHGFIIKNIYGNLWKEIYFFWHQCPIGSTHYWLIPDDPLRDMKIRQAQTGQPVWIKMKSSTYWVIAMRGFDLIYQDHVVSVIKSITPDWNIPNAEYSFTPFEKEIEFKEEV